jgi:hypothetical protein
MSLQQVCKYASPAASSPPCCLGSATQPGSIGNESAADMMIGWRVAATYLQVTCKPLAAASAPRMPAQTSNMCRHIWGTTVCKQRLQQRIDVHTGDGEHIQAAGSCRVPCVDARRMPPGCTLRPPHPTKPASCSMACTVMGAGAYCLWWSALLACLAALCPSHTCRLHVVLFHHHHQRHHHLLLLVQDYCMQACTSHMHATTTANSCPTTTTTTTTALMQACTVLLAVHDCVCNHVA